MRKTIFLFLLLISLSTHAQRSAFIFEPTMYGGLNLGINNVTAEGAYDAYTPLEGLGLEGGFHLGLNFSSIVGLKAGVDMQRFRYPKINFANEMRFSGIALSIDAMLNLSNLLGYYNINRSTDISVFIGTGTLYRSPSDDATLALMQNEIFVPLRLGGQMDYRLNRSLNLNFVALLNILKDNFNSYETGFKYDLVPKLSVGLSYSF